LASTDPFSDVFLEHVGYLASKFHSGRTATADDKAQEPLAFLLGRRGQAGFFEVSDKLFAEFEDVRN
jgi:hypothetical protein